VNIKFDPNNVVITSTSQTTKEIPRQLIAEPQHVDFAHPEFCTGCDPQTCVVEGKSFSGRNWRDVLVALTEDFLQSKPKAMELYHTSLYPNGEREFLLKKKPKFSARQLNPTQTNNPSGSARGYLRSLRMLKEFINENVVRQVA